MRYRNLIFINKINRASKRYQKTLKNRMRNKIKLTKKEIIKLTIPTKKLKLTWKEWTKLMRKTWSRSRNMNKNMNRTQLTWTI